MTARFTNSLRTLLEGVTLGRVVAVLLVALFLGLSMAPADAAGKDEISKRMKKLHEMLLEAGVYFVAIGGLVIGVEALFLHQLSKVGLAVFAFGAAMIFGSLGVAEYLKT